jgi:hypothetical protein
MNRALGVPDVVHRIIEKVDAADPRDVVALARVSGAFSERALDVLWAEPPIWDLAMLMSDDVKIVRHERRTKHYGPDRPMFSEVEHTVVSRDADPAPSRTADGGRQMLCVEGTDVRTAHLGARFMTHAPRVRVLHLRDKRDQHSGHDRFFVAPAVLAMWAARRGLFSNLTDLMIAPEFQARTPAHRALLPRFLAHAALQRLEIHYGVQALQYFERAQAALTKTCTGLHELVLAYNASAFYQGPPPGAAVRDRWAALVGAMISHAPRLRRLTVTLPMKHSDLLVISMLPALSMLEVSAVMDVPDDTHFVLPPDSFPALRSLTVADVSEGAMLSHHVLSFSSGPAFERCSFTIACPLPGALGAALMAKLLQHAHLTHVVVNFLQPQPDQLELGLLDRETTDLLAGLCPSECLQDLTIGVAFPLNAAHIASVLGLYPGLERWVWGYSPHSYAKISLEEFMVIAKARPDLRNLPIVIASTDLPHEDARASFGTHSYDTGIHIQITHGEQQVRQQALWAVIWELFPNVRPPSFNEHQLIGAGSFEGPAARLHGRQSCDSAQGMILL